VGGGINLRPADFAKSIRVTSSPLIRRVRSAPGIKRSAGAAPIATKHPSRPIERRPWSMVSQSTGDVAETRWSNGHQRSVVVRINEKSGYRRQEVATAQSAATVTVDPSRNTMTIRRSRYPTEIIATGDLSGGGMVVLRRGRAIHAPARQDAA
jgi:hypothetical protein